MVKKSVFRWFTNVCRWSTRLLMVYRFVCRWFTSLCRRCTRLCRRCTSLCRWFTGLCIDGLQVYVPVVHTSHCYIICKYHTLKRNSSRYNDVNIAGYFRLQLYVVTQFYICPRVSRATQTTGAQITAAANPTDHHGQGLNT